MIKSTFAVLGPVIYKVPDEAVADKTMQVRILQRNTDITVSRSCLDTDGTLDYNELLSYLGGNRERNEMIVKDLVNQKGHSCLILASRLEQLRNIMDLLPDELRSISAMIDGGMTSKKGKAERESCLHPLAWQKKVWISRGLTGCSWYLRRKITQ